MTEDVGRDSTTVGGHVANRAKFMDDGLLLNHLKPGNR